MRPATRERLRALLAREAEWSAVRAQGAGGQNVNKVSSAVHLRFDVHASALPAAHKARLLALRDQRLTDEGVIVLKAQEQRTQARNREVALDRLCDLVASVAQPPRARIATKPTRASAAPARGQERAQRGQARPRQGGARLARHNRCMAKERSVYTCTECGGTSAKWLGKCPACGAWNTLED